VSDRAVALRDLVITEVNAVGPEFGGGPANMLDGFLVAKGRNARKAQGITSLDLGDGAVWVIADDYVEKLRAKDGDDGVVAHFKEVLNALGVGSEPLNRTPAYKASAGVESPPSAPPAANVVERARVLHRDEKGRFAGRWFQRAQSKPKLAGTTFFR
jgi:hypothetical protein